MESQEKIAVVTGASRGIGKAISLYLGERGYDLLLIARDENSLRNTLDDIIKYENSKTPMLLSADVCDYERLKQEIEKFLQRKGKIDLLINCAGYVKRGTSDLPREEFIKMVNVNLIGTFNLINIVSPEMKKKRKGHIINISSYSGKVARKYLGGYAASKFGVMGLSESLQKELSEYNIYVTAICPSLVATDMTADVNMDHKDMLKTSDIVKTIDYILSLSSVASIKEIAIQCTMKVAEEK